MKVLIISHVPLTGTYGAATSLRGHINILNTVPGLEFAVVQQLGYHRGPRVISIPDTLTFSFLLPISGNYDGYSVGYIREVYYFIRKVISFCFLSRLKRKIIEIRPDIIHINSLVLADLVRWLRSDRKFDNVTIVASVREVLGRRISKRDIEGILLIDKYICIDRSTKARLCEVTGMSLHDSRIETQLNPFFSTNNVWSAGKRFRDKYELIFAIVGSVTEDKGVLFVVESFVSANISNAVLLVVGNSTGLYSRKVKKLCSEVHNVINLGELADLNNLGFYNCIDVIIRGDASFRTGRTVYEAIFAGACAILPCDGDEYLGDQEICKVLDRIKFYTPSNQEQLVIAINFMSIALMCQSRDARSRIDNSDEYAHSLKQFYFGLQ